MCVYKSFELGASCYDDADNVEIDDAETSNIPDRIEEVTLMHAVGTSACISYNCLFSLPTRSAQVQLKKMTN